MQHSNETHTDAVRTVELNRDWIKTLLDFENLLRLVFALLHLDDQNDVAEENDAKQEV